MVLYNFKSLCVVPSAKDFVDIVLSKTQRKTPTVVHQGYQISRIRKFYMRKVKFTQTSYHEKLTQILDEFPRLDDIHPFYADLINVLYSRDHYKLALGQLSTARTLVDNVCKDYLKLLKFGDSLYRCKELKRAALGRMCTVMKKLGPSLAYLEQVRQHLSRLPSIDPSTRTIMITGFPNTGKSSFINKVSNANVDVQPYAFTTKSLFIGHCDYKYMRWQVIDSPGILDHSLEERNTIEMQAITALAHLHATVLYFLDISESCGYSLQKQVDLFHNIKPLFQNKPLLIVANKQDLKKLDELDEEEKKLVESMLANRPDTKIMPMSNMTDEGITSVLHSACDMLLAHRIERKLASTNKMQDLSNRLQISMPVARDNKPRPVSIPESVLKQREARAKKAKLSPDAAAAAAEEASSSRKLERDIEMEHGGPGIYSGDYKKNYILDNPDWKYDIVPEILDGKNVADFIDPDIDRKLAELEAEEAEYERQAQERGEMMEEGESDLDEEQKEQVEQIRTHRKVIIQNRRLLKTNNKPVLPRKARARNLDAAAANLEGMGLDAEKMVERARSKSRVRGRKRGRDDEEGDAEMDTTADGEDAMMDDAAASSTASTSRGRSSTRSASLARLRSRSRDHKRIASPSPFRDVSQKLQAERLNRSVHKKFVKTASRGESDRVYLDPKPKHLYSGTTSIGKRDRR